jgi:hypothetical protein
MDLAECTPAEPVAPAAAEGAVIEALASVGVSQQVRGEVREGLQATVAEAITEANQQAAEAREEARNQVRTAAGKAAAEQVSAVLQKQIGLDGAMLSAHSASEGAVREVFEKTIAADLEDDHAPFEQAQQVEHAVVCALQGAGVSLEVQNAVTEELQATLPPQIAAATAEELQTQSTTNARPDMAAAYAAQATVAQALHEAIFTPDMPSSSSSLWPQTTQAELDVTNAMPTNVSDGAAIAIDDQIEQNAAAEHALQQTQNQQEGAVDNAGNPVEFEEDARNQILALKTDVGDDAQRRALGQPMGLMLNESSEAMTNSAVRDFETAEPNLRAAGRATPPAPPRRHPKPPLRSLPTPPVAVADPFFVGQMAEGVQTQHEQGLDYADNAGEAAADTMPRNVAVERDASVQPEGVLSQASTMQKELHTHAGMRDAVEKASKAVRQAAEHNPGVPVSPLAVEAAVREALESPSVSLEERKRHDVMRRVRATVPQAIRDAVEQATNAKGNARRKLKQKVASAVQKEVETIMKTSDLDFEAQDAVQVAVKRVVAPTQAGSFSDGAFSMMRRGVEDNGDELFRFPQKNAPKKRKSRSRAPASGMATVSESGATFIDPRVRPKDPRTTPQRPTDLPE